MQVSKIPQFVTFPAIISAAVAIVFVASEVTGISIAQFGIYPRSFEGLQGILFAPFIHGSPQHLMSNLTALPILLSLLVLLNPKNYSKIFAFLYVLTGIIVWLTARSSYHIGISGVIYALASFSFFEGIVSERKGAAAISLLITLLYGGMVWGALPQAEGISWESHLGGGIAGFVAAFVFAHRPQKIVSTHDYQAPMFNLNAQITDNSYTSVTYTYIKENAVEEGSSTAKKQKKIKL